MDLSHIDSGLSLTSGPSRALPDCPFKDCLGQTSTSEAFAYTNQPLKEEPGKTTCPLRKYFCEIDLRRPLPEVPNGKTEEQEEAGREAAEQEA